MRVKVRDINIDFHFFAFSGVGFNGEFSSDKLYNMGVSVKLPAVQLFNVHFYFLPGLWPVLVVSCRPACPGGLFPFGDYMVPHLHLIVKRK